MKKTMLIALVVALAIPLTFVMAFGQNGAPSGPHYNLNIIGVPKAKTALMKDDGVTGKYGHAIFVPLSGSSKILLAQGDFQVLDKNGTDGEAAFRLPAPDPDNDGTTQYSVFARALGTPGGKASMSTCATDPVDGELVCSVISLSLDASARPSKFTNVSKYLLYIYADFGGTGVQRVPLFGSGLEDFFWGYDNDGLKLAQLRFYQCSTTVPAPSDPTGEQTYPADSGCF